MSATEDPAPTFDAGHGVSASRYLTDNFLPEDRLAVVLINKREDAVIQRLASASKIAAPEFISWMRRKNDERYDVYVSMNTLRSEAQSRTKGEVARIRHIYLDLDENGPEILDGLLKRSDLPKPNYLINTSSGKWQVVWKVNDFDKRRAEELQKGLARECGADPAATDCARVLRIPDFFNHKYTQPYLVRAGSLATGTYHPEQFPRIAVEERSDGERAESQRGSFKTINAGGISQSERDWAFAKRSLARGDAPYLVAAAIASYRRFDKHDPQDYAARTVAKAAAALQAEHVRMGTQEHERT